MHMTGTVLLTMQYRRPCHPCRIIEARRKGPLHVIQHPADLLLGRLFFRGPRDYPGAIPMHEVQIVRYGRHHLRIAPQDLHFGPL